ncbi:translocator protein 2 isoform X3 [Halichoerus grypus]|uniref:translocator protein 2 isoform X3 n=1 Tax=Halichoerus grypus TaxID=9711 RepID=UPI001658ED1D|nr:translocator protein 2 isoform X3 [Halichoerus grypus]
MPVPPPLSLEKDRPDGSLTPPFSHPPPSSASHTTDIIGHSAWEVCCLSYASYLVWKDLGGGFGRPLALPLGLYAVQLAVSWAVLILFFAAHTHGLALLHLLLLYGLVVSTALIWHPINKLAAVLLLPYLAWLTVTASIAYRLWRDSLCPNHQPQPMGEKSD